MPRPLSRRATLLALAALPLAGCTVIYHRPDNADLLPEARVKPGISILLGDSIGLVRNRRIGLLTNNAAVDEKGRTDISLLHADPRATRAHVKLIELLSPEHGLAAKLDRPDIPSTVDLQTGLPIISLYGPHGTEAPPDSAFRGIDALVIDLQDVGSRTWTYDGVMVFSMRAAARNHKPVIVLDRPNPITGSLVEGPVLDSALADPGTDTRPGIAWALYPIPLRHGMTFAELARFYNAELHIGADLHVVPARGWSREVWFDRTGLPFVAPSPNLPSLESEMLYPALVPFEATNLSVGRGTTTPFQRIGAPWLDADRLAAWFKDHHVLGVRITAEDFTPEAPGDRKYPAERVHGLRFEVTEREELHTSRLLGALISAIHRFQPDQLKIDTLRFDRLLGSSEVRRALLSGQDPQAVIDRTYGPAYAFRQRAQPYFLY